MSNILILSNYWRPITLQFYINIVKTFLSIKEPKVSEIHYIDNITSLFKFSKSPKLNIKLLKDPPNFYLFYTGSLTVADMGHVSSLGMHNETTDRADFRGTTKPEFKYTTS